MRSVMMLFVTLCLLVIFATTAEAGDGGVLDTIVGSLQRIVNALTDLVNMLPELIREVLNGLIAFFERLIDAFNGGS